MPEHLTRRDPESTLIFRIVAWGVALATMVLWYF